jgi:uncharacterized membrane protein YcaP (DUF421 family)
MHAIVSDMFVPGIPVLEKVIRTLLVYAFLVVGLRLAGKRELAQLNPFDLVVLLTLSNTLQNAIIGNDNSVSGGFLGAAVLLAVNYLLVRFIYRHQRVDRLLEGQSLLLIDQGRVVTKNLRRELITEDELRSVCRRQGVEDIDQVEKAILETSGTISVFTRHPTRDESFDEALARRLDAIEQLLRGRQAGDGDEAAGRA